MEQVKGGVMSYTKGKLEVLRGDKGELFIESSDGLLVALVYESSKTEEEAPANAKRIIHCWNNFDRLMHDREGLLYALKELVKNSGEFYLRQAKQALVKAEEK